MTTRPDRTDPEHLIAELRDNADAISEAIATAGGEALRHGIYPQRALSHDGTPLLGPLVAARGHVLAALAHLIREATP
jgi:hypothetical protein